jgi:hypothetical protein
MATNDSGQGILNKLIWLVDTIKRKKMITFKELNNLWCQNVEMSGGLDLPKRTFYNWITQIADMFGIVIANERCGSYRYYIENEDSIGRDDLRKWLFDTFSASCALSNCLSVKERIMLENIPSGLQFLKPIIDAMKENRVLRITYHGYWRQEESTFDVQPYCVKLFRQRWYMVAMSAFPDPRIYALDRVVNLCATDETFEMPKDWSAEEFFYGCFGVIADKVDDIQTVKIKAYGSQVYYIRGLPLHPSQQETKRTDEYSIFAYRIRPTYDFIQELLWHSDTIEVLEPQCLREKVMDKLDSMLSRYGERGNE